MILAFRPNRRPGSSLSNKLALGSGCAVPMFAPICRYAAALMAVAVVSKPSKRMEMCSEVERLINAGWTMRRGGGEAIKQRPLLPEWKGREPPENP